MLQEYEKCDVCKETIVFKEDGIQRNVANIIKIALLVTHPNGMSTEKNFTVCSSKCAITVCERFDDFAKLELKKTQDAIKRAERTTANLQAKAQEVLDAVASRKLTMTKEELSLIPQGDTSGKEI